MATETVHERQIIIEAIRGEGFWQPKDPSKIASTFGNITAISRRLGVSRQTVYSYMAKWQTVADAVDDERERRKDFVEDKMLERVMQGSDTMIIFFAKTQMKDRGYIERHEIDLKVSDLEKLSDDELRALAES